MGQLSKRFAPLGCYMVIKIVKFVTNALDYTMSSVNNNLGISRFVNQKGNHPFYKIFVHN